MMLLSLFRGQLIPVPAVEKALAFLEQEGGDPARLPAGRRMITRNPTIVREALGDVAKAYGADEVFVVNIIHEHAARMRSYELIYGSASTTTTLSVATAATYSLPFLPW